MEAGRVPRRAAARRRRNGKVFLVERQRYLYALKLGADAVDLQSEVNVLQAIAGQKRRLGSSPARFWSMWTTIRRRTGRTIRSMSCVIFKGMTLGDYLERQGKEWLPVVGFHLLGKLAELHEAGWAFGDLKVENVIVDRLRAARARRLRRRHGVRQRRPAIYRDLRPRLLECGIAHGGCGLRPVLVRRSLRTALRGTQAGAAFGRIAAADADAGGAGEARGDESAAEAAQRLAAQGLLRRIPQCARSGRFLAAMDAPAEPRARPCRRAGAALDEGLVRALGRGPRDDGILAAALGALTREPALFRRSDFNRLSIL